MTTDNGGAGRSIEYLPLEELITRLHPENAKGYRNTLVSLQLSSLLSVC